MQGPRAAADIASVVVNFASDRPGSERVVADLKAADGNASAIGNSTECTSTSAPAASFTRFCDGAVSPEITIERSRACAKSYRGSAERVG